jgi:hypothetical protein
MLAEKAMHLGEGYQPLLEAAAHNCIDVLESKGRDRLHTGKHVSDAMIHLVEQ